MGLLEELIILVKDTIAEASERKREQPTGAAPRSAEEIEALRRTLARRAAEQRHAEQEAEEHAAHEHHAQQERQRAAHERERHHQKQVKAVHSAQVAHQTGAVDQSRIVRMLRQPHALREMIVMKEILDKPLALRPRR